MINNKMNNIKNKVFAGLDLSLTSPGVVFIDQKQLLYVNSLQSKSKEMERINEYFIWIIELLKKYKPVLVALEGYSFGSRGNAIFNIGEFTGVIKYKLWRMNIPIIKIAPMTLKKFASGNGRSEKNKVMLAVYKQFGYEFENDDECDAYVLSIIAKCFWIITKNYFDYKFKEKTSGTYLEVDNNIDKLNLKIYQKETIKKIIERVKENNKKI